MPLSLQKLCCVGTAFISNTDSPAKQSNKSSSQTRAPTKAPDVALATRRSYFSISAETNKFWARSDSASEVRSVVDEASYSSKQFRQDQQSRRSKGQRSRSKIQAETKTAKAESRAPKQPSTPLSHDHHATYHNLAQLAASILTTLDPPKKSHSHILEGCLCAFLDHLGFFPSLAIFIDPQPPQEQETFAQLEVLYRAHILDNAMTFHKYPSDTH